jgi:Domain of Unknown Function (DUF1080)
MFLDFGSLGFQVLSRRHFLKTATIAAGSLCFNGNAVGIEAREGNSRREAALSPKDEAVRLFDGKDLAGLYTWLKDAKYEDPRKVFTIQDGLLRISGEVDGYIATQREYRDYHLVVEYKWGSKTYGSKTVRNSGILLHAVGPDGNPSPWMSSIECQVAQGCVGDFIVIRGKDETGSTVPVTITSETILGPDGRTRWKKGGTPTVYSGKQFWWSLHDPDFEELIDTRGKQDVESPLGEWTRVECVCDGNRITAIVNGTTVNECFDVFPSAGKILLESEGFEILFRKFELQPLKNKRA